MLELNSFLELSPRNRTIGQFEKSKLENLKGMVPEEIIEFLHQEQKAVFGKDFFWSVLPSNYHSILDSWGLDGQNSFVFLRSSFGCLAYFYNNDFYVLNPHKGKTTVLVGNIPNLLFNLALAYVINLQTERHKAGRTYGRSNLKTDFILKYALESVKINSDASILDKEKAKRELAVTMLLNELSLDVAVMTTVYNKSFDNEVWKDIEAYVVGADKETLVDEIRARVQSGLSQISNQPMNNLKN